MSRRLTLNDSERASLGALAVVEFLNWAAHGPACPDALCRMRGGQHARDCWRAAYGASALGYALEAVAQLPLLRPRALGDRWTSPDYPVRRKVG